MKYLHIVWLSFIFIFTGCTINSVTPTTMKLISPSFANSSEIPTEFTCDGANASPALAWSEVPLATQSLVLKVHDPDASNGDWVHWLVINMPNTVRGMAESEIPIGGVQVQNSFGQLNWGGPCPSSGTHHYIFELYALDVPEIQAKNVSEVKQAMRDHVLAEAQLVGLYQRR